METPSSTRRITRSQVASLNNSNIPMSRKIEESEKALSKSRQMNRKQQDLSATKTQQDRPALIDRTNDSPIVGLAMGSLGTPLSSIAKQQSNRVKKTPGSGEALLRGQVRTLLQKVEEEAEPSKLSLENRPFLHHLQGGVVHSPFLAPTPANTPQISNLSEDGSLNNNSISSVTPSQIVEEHLISQVINDIFDGTKQEESIEPENLITARSLLLDFSEKSEVSDASECSSVLTNQEESPSQDIDDASSIWSIQVNASTNEEEEEEEVIEEEEEEEEYGIGEEDEEKNEDGFVEEICEGMSRISMNERKKTAMFAGKHTRFVYDSDDEFVEEICEEGGEVNGNFSQTVMRLKGLPTPKGKHVRFPPEDED